GIYPRRRIWRANGLGCGSGVGLGDASAWSSGRQPTPRLLAGRARQARYEHLQALQRAINGGSDSQQATLNPRVPGSGPWRRSRPVLLIFRVELNFAGSAWTDLVRCLDANDAHSARRGPTHSNVSWSDCRAHWPACPHWFVAVRPRTSTVLITAAD